MTKIHELVGVPQVDGDFGIEIEVEGTDKVIRDKRWNCVPDGSLRGRSMEYVLAKPLPIAQVEGALIGLTKLLEGEPLEFSFRTSVHVHMNVQQLTYEQLLNLIYTYMLLEEPLINYCGNERKGNRFCLRLQDAEGVIETLNAIFKEKRYINHINIDHVRYAALNLGALRTYGSLEFRAMKGNLDIDYISNWINTLYRIREFAKEMESPVEIYNLFSDLGAKGFMDKVLGQASRIFEYPGVEQDIQRSFSLSIDLPHSYPVKKVVKKVITKEEEEDIFRDLFEDNPAPVALPRPWENVPIPEEGRMFMANGINFQFINGQWRAV